MHFHYQEIIEKQERSQLGYYQLASEGEPTTGAKRVLLTLSTSLTTEYIYEKHPTEHQSLKLVFFHGQETANGNKFIGVRALDIPDRVFKLQMSVGGKKLKSAKHPTAAYTENSSLYFVGKIEDEKAVKVFRLDVKDLQAIQAAFESGE